MALYLLFQLGAAQLCPPVCRTCDAGAVCSSCRNNAGLLATGVCVCDPGFYPDAGNCSPCSTGCVACNDIECYGCASGYGLTLSGTCVKCAEDCSTCSESSNCRKCVSGKFLSLSGKCELCSSCSSPLTVSVESPSPMTYSMLFSRPIAKTEFAADDLSVKSIPASTIEWTVTFSSDLLVSVAGGPWTNTTLIVISFTHPSEIYDNYGFPLANSEISVPLPSNYQPPANSPLPNTTDSSTETADTDSVSTADRTIGGSVAATAATAGALAGVTSFAVTTLAQMEYFSYLSDLGVTLPSDCFKSFRQKSIFPNIFNTEPLRADRRLNALSRSPSDFAAEIGGFLTALLVVLTVHGLCKLLNLAFPWKVLAAIIAKCEWSIYLYLWSFAYLGLSLAAVRELYIQPDSQYWRRVMNNVFASSVLALLVCSPLYFAYYLSTHRAVLFSSAPTGYKSAWNALVSHIRSDKAPAQYLHPLSLLNRLMYASALVLLADHPRIRCIALLLPAGCMCAFALYIRPLQSAGMRLLQIAAEVDSLAVYAMLSVSVFLGVEESQVLCTAIFVLLCKAVACSVGIAALGVYAKVKSKLAQHKKSRVQPNTRLQAIEVTTYTEGSDSRTETEKPRLFERVMDSEKVVWPMSPTYFRSGQASPTRLKTRRVAG